MTDYITGSGGFIGSRLFARLKDAVCIPHRDITHGKYEPCGKFFFLSTYGNMAHHDEPGVIFKANVLDVQHVLHYCHPWYFIFLSSSSVTLPVQTPYSIAKRCAEHLIEDQGPPYLIIRPYSVTGVGEQKEHLIPKLIDSCLNGTRMDFVPEPVHDFVDVEDVVERIMCLVNAGTTGTFEIGNGQPVTNGEVLEIVERVTGNMANIQIRKSLRAYDSHNWYSKMPRWDNTKSLLTSITEMVEHAKSSR